MAALGATATKPRKKAEGKLLLTLACGATVEAAARQCGLSVRTATAAWLSRTRGGQLQDLRGDMVQRTMGTLTAMGGEACGLVYPHHRAPPLSTWKLLPGRRPSERTPPWYDLPEFFRSCPYCGASSYDTDWPHLVPNHDYAWKGLNGYAVIPAGRAR